MFPQPIQNAKKKIGAREDGVKDVQKVYLQT